jgi:hypothetical protein
MAEHPIRLAWSFSGIKNYETCPKKYYHLKVAKDVQDEPGEHAMYGTAVHLAAEEYVKDGKPLPSQFAFMQSQLDYLTQIPGEKLCEYEMGLRVDLTPCGFNDPDYFFRGIADLIILDREKRRAFIVDYKTGKSSRYADTGQLDLMALAVFKHFPEVDTIRAGLLFCVANDFIKRYYSRTDCSDLPERFKGALFRLEASMKNGVFNAKTSGLCRNFCPVLQCTHNGKR